MEAANCPTTPPALYSTLSALLGKPYTYAAVRTLCRMDFPPMLAANSKSFSVMTVVVFSLGGQQLHLLGDRMDTNPASTLHEVRVFILNTSK